MFDGFEKILEGQMDERGILFDPDSPRYIQAAAVVISVRNVDHWESIFMVDPPEQSRYMTKGLIEAAAEMA